MKRALAIFAKTPLPGLVKTRLSPPLSLQQGAELYRCMFLDTIARVRPLNADTVLFYEGESDFFHKSAPHATLMRQHDGGLGTRLEQAFDQLAELGYDSRVVIGSDAPDLPFAYLEDAFARLEGGSDTVFGPASDGGYYLVGVRRGAGSIFQGIPWSTAKVLETSLKQAQASGLSSTLLAPWYDVDCYQDLLRPGLSDPLNGAPLTRSFLAHLCPETLAPTADAV
ncbi:TIGR04282 family arsenosugar biosynthesis glycosyltransferase [Citrifermentans bremense]|uniref:TIGR04282 family arsenosugar biosynthesis glycosyltransferase n=1 Tax=Citrifermentans bremense TaxID=60035 RepID=UPI0003F4CE6B|nr:TIGR04282 family arsenosugar biosynthesis glycosyltransferase [Citrifermentans bremense]